MAAVGICGTDLHQVKGEFTRPTPMVLGHEGSGVVEWAGSPGLDRCAPATRSCSRGRPAAAPAWAAAAAGPPPAGRSTPRSPAARSPTAAPASSLRGETVYRGTVTGCFAERVVVGERAALPVRGVPLEEAALLGCAALTGVGAALYAADVQPGSSVLVVGAGGVGQFVVQGARLAGASTIIASDGFAERRERARALGARAVAPEELEEAVAEAAPDGVDYAFDAVGLPETVATAVRHLRDGGTAVVVGLPPAGQRFELEPFELIRREKRVTGTLYGSLDPAVALPVLLEHVSAGRLELASLVGDRYPLEQIDAAVAASLAGSGNRVLVTFP